MPNRSSNLREKYLDGEALYKKYWEMGDARTMIRLATWAVSIGMAKPTKVSKYNPNGVPTMGVWKAMWRWASLKENKDKAYEIYFKWTAKNIDEWNSMMLITIKTAWQYNTVAKYQRFLRLNGWTQ